MQPGTFNSGQNELPEPTAAARGCASRLRGATLTASCALLAALIASPGNAQAAPPGQKQPFPSVRLKNNRFRGEQAIGALADKLPSIAAWYRMTPQKLEETLRQDRTAWIDESGRLLYIEEVPELPDAADELSLPAEAEPEAALQPLEQTFLLHSRPGASRVIYLDFNGYVATGTAWNSTYGTTINAPAFDLDGNAASFSAAEQERIQYIWQRVAEDYAPFGVDVTTQEPAADAITRSSSSDTIFGTRVVITRDFTAGTANSCGCGGFAYVGIFDDTGDRYKPAWVFYNALGAGSEKATAEAISHEAGHNLGLAHDGTATQGYYAGHGSGATGWAPIMGVGYSKEVTQWSKGEYSGANNLEDDLVILQNTGAPLVADDHGNDIANASSLQGSGGGSTLSGNGVIERRADSDVFALASGAGTISISVAPAARGPNLDLSAQLLDTGGTVLATSSPADSLAATINYDGPAGTYFLRVDGVGTGNPLNTGYSDYGSLGRYQVSGSISDPGALQAPVARLSASPAQGTVPLPVQFDGRQSTDADGQLVSYAWDFGDGSAPVVGAADTVAHTYGVPGTFTATLTVTDDDGLKDSETLPVTVNPDAQALTLRVGNITMSATRSGSFYRCNAAVAIRDGSNLAKSGASVTGRWSGTVSGTYTRTTSTAGTASFSSPWTSRRGTCTFSVSGVSASGYTYTPGQNVLTSKSLTY